jgi:hypothetical protein
MRAAALLAVAMAAMAGVAQAQEFKGPCPVGQQVTNRENKTGVVIAADQSTCRVEYPDGTKGTHMFWMLRPAGAPRVDSKAVGAVKLGRYACYTGSHFGFDIHIRSASQYTDRAGTTGQYRYDASTQAISFESGSLQGTYSKYLGEGKFGISSRAGGSFNTVCNFKP